MVTHLNIALDDDVAERARKRKEELGVTWPEFIEWAAGELEAGRGGSDRVSESAGVDGVVAGLDLPGSGERLEGRRKTIQKLYDYLREHGTARRRDFLELVDSEVVGYSSPESFWANTVKGKDALKGLPGVIAPGEGEHTWRYQEGVSNSSGGA